MLPPPFPLPPPPHTTLLYRYESRARRDNFMRDDCDEMRCCDFCKDLYILMCIIESDIEYE